MDLMNLYEKRQIRHNRILVIRGYIKQGKDREQCIGLCMLKYKCTRQTAISYVDEAAEPFMRAWLKAHPTEKSTSLDDYGDNS